ncbi:hypothetical protein LCGC14_0693180 [marine sediment metagenome]|uniref:Uncharacterized protein n=1 Tax=marine sediment metagenome TaxID=412755 RepID=A0A0F9R581_9ZZZZ
MAAEQSPEERVLSEMDGMLRAIDLLNAEFTRRVQGDQFAWRGRMVGHFRRLAEIYQAEGWEKAEEWLARGRDA